MVSKATDVTVFTLTEAAINELFEERSGLAARLYHSLAAELAAGSVPLPRVSPR